MSSVGSGLSGPRNSVDAPRAGLVGPGAIGQLHLQTLRALGIPVTALVASSLDSARAHAERLDVEHVYASAAEMAASGNVDVVHVCTPNAGHASAAIAAVDAGCHLVCEKPLTVDLAQAEDLLRRIERSSVTAGTCYHYRYFEGILVARRLVQSGVIGTVRMIAGRYVSQELRGLKDSHWLRDPAIVGPAVSLADVGVHWFDLAEHVSGLPIRAVLAQPVDAGEGVPFAHGAAVLMRLGGGSAATAAISQDCCGIATDDITLEMYGSTGTVRWSLDYSGETLCAWNQDGDVVKRARYAETSQLGTHRAFRLLMDDLYARIRRAESTAPTFADGYHGVAILAAAVESAQLSRWIEIPSSGQALCA
jgi:predicted dehydrogenase